MAPEVAAYETVKPFLASGNSDQTQKFKSEKSEHLFDV
jgi:hypothetical protein